MSKDKSEPAFPVGANEYGGHGTYFGMTLRDYFAAQAIQPFMVWALDQPHFENYDSASKAAAGYAKSAYVLADAMIAARELPDDQGDA